MTGPQPAPPALMIAMSETAAATYTLSMAEYHATKAKIDKINARAAKKGFTGTVQLTGTRATLTQERDGLIVERVVVHATITGKPPVYQGWTFLARLDAVGEGLIVNAAPGADLSRIDRDAMRPGWCDHCRTSRDRRKMFLVVNEAGELRQVGSTCVKDFLGAAVVPTFIDTESVYVEAGFGGDGPDTYSVRTVVGTAMAAVQLFGFRRSGEHGSTRGVVDAALLGTGGDRGRETRRQLAANRVADSDVDALIAEAVTALESENGAGYLSNLKVALAAEYVEAKTFGLLVSVVPFVARLRAQASAQAEPRASHWLGQAGEKITVTGTVVTAMTVDGYAYNSPQRFIVLRDGDGNLVKTVTTAAWSWDVASGDEVTVCGTVKDHVTYRDAEQTVLTRTKRLDIPAAAQA